MPIATKDMPMSSCLVGFSPNKRIDSNNANINSICANALTYAIRCMVIAVNQPIEPTALVNPTKTLGRQSFKIV